MDKRKILEAIELELRRSRKLRPNYPDHVAAQAGIVCKEAGELMQACLQGKYEKKPGVNQKEQMRIEAIHTAASAIRFLENMKE